MKASKRGAGADGKTRFNPLNVKLIFDAGCRQTGYLYVWQMNKLLFRTTLSNTVNNN